MNPVLALLAGRRVTKAYRTTRGWQTAQENADHYIRGLRHGALAAVAVVVLLVALG